MVDKTKLSNTNFFKANHSDPLVGTKSSQILPRNSSRSNVLFINDSDTTIYLSIGVAARVNTGIRINSGGGSYSMSEEEGNLTDQNIFAISSSNNKKILITEFTQ